MGFVSDVEGNVTFFKEFVECRGVLGFETPEDDPKDDRCFFVYGGDAVDKDEVDESSNGEEGQYELLLLVIYFTIQSWKQAG